MRREQAFITEGFSNWRKGPERFREHQNSVSHMHALAQLDHYNRSHPVCAQLSNQKLENQKSAKECLHAIFTSIRYLAEQGLPLRGHSDGNGNFEALLQLRIADVPALDPWLNRYCSYTSPAIQNEILSLFGQQLVRSIAASIRNAGQFAVIVDGTTDISGKNQESICLRYVDEELHPHEEFIGLYEAPDSTGKTVAACVRDTLIRLDLPIEQLRGQTYDGASNMSGIYNGCQAIIQKEQPLALYVHCAAHCVNLVSQSTCESIPVVRDALGTVQELGALFSASSNLRHSFFVNAQADDISIRKIKPLCPTRWLVRVDAINNLLTQYSQVLASLDELGKLTTNAATRARGLRDKLTNGDSVLGMEMALLVLRPLEQLNRSLQSKSSTVGGMLQAVSLILTELKSLRSDETFAKLLAKVTGKIQELDVDELKLPRVHRTPARLTGIAKPHIPTTLTDHFRPMFFELTDIAVTNLQQRFTNCSGLRQYQKLEETLLKGSVDVETQKLLAPYNEITWSLFSIQMPLFRKQSFSTLSEAADVMRTMSPETRAIFSEVVTLIKLLIVNPAASAEAERSFSALRRLKTWLRNNMTQERLNNIAICNVHQSLLRNIDLVPLMQEFVSRGREEIRQKLFGTFSQ